MISKLSGTLFGTILLLTLSFGCGSEKGGSSSGSSTSPINIPGASALPPTSATAYANLVAWYQSTTEGAQFTTAYARTEKRRTKIYSASTCNPKSVSVWGISLNYSFCGNSSTAPTQSDATKSVVPVQNGASKTVNGKLSALLSGSAVAGTLINVSQGNGNYGAGTIFTLQFTKTSNPNYQVIYVIDTGINSAFSPVYIMDNETRTEESLIEVL